MGKPWLAAILNIVPGIGIGYLYVRSFGWFILGIVLALALTMVDSAIGIVIWIDCFDFPGAPGACSDTELAAKGRDIKFVVAATFLLLVTFNAGNAWRLASRRNRERG